MACNYCKGDKYLSERDQFSNKGEFFFGVDSYAENGFLYLECVADTYEPNYQEIKIKINFCPMCGEKFEKDGRKENENL